MQQKLSLPALFTFPSASVHHSPSVPFFSFAMNVNPSMVAPFASKNLGDLSKRIILHGELSHVKKYVF
jgi:hypothetical protein